jgi:hypothetical protein
VARRNDGYWCHLTADTLEELHAFAAKLGMKREWFQDKVDRPHYDLTPGKRLQAIRLGAVEGRAPSRKAERPMESRREWQCWELLHGGEGPRGRDVVVIGLPKSAKTAAEEAAEYFDAIEDREQPGVDLDGTEQFIEVDTSEGPKRFSVVTEVVRKHEARELP